MREKIDRIIRAEWSKLNPEEETTINRILEEANKRNSSISRGRFDADNEAASDEDSEAA